MERKGRIEILLAANPKLKSAPKKPVAPVDSHGTNPERDEGKPGQTEPDGKA
jgi:hypothetical protein